MKQIPHVEALRPAAADQIPTLTQAMVVSNAPQDILEALNTRAEERGALMALSDELVQNLRPEIERLTADLVQRTLQEVWDKRSRSKLDD